MIRDMEKHEREVYFSYRSKRTADYLTPVEVIKTKRIVIYDVWDRSLHDDGIWAIDDRFLFRLMRGEVTHG